jgi:hypothetical protein
MADWIVCPACQLKHSRRPNGICPRCNNALDAAPDAGAPAAFAAEPPDAPPPPSGLPSLAGPSGLGNLAQSARSQQLKSARGTMIAIGLLTIVVNVIFYAMVAGQVQDAIDAEIKKLPVGMVANPVKVAEIRDRAVRSAHLIHGAFVLVGFAFLGCAALVDKMPVPATITALCLYLGGTAIFAMLDPSSIGSGIIIKIIIIVALVKAVQAAIAYQKEESAALET